MAVALPRVSDRPHPQGLYVAIEGALVFPKELAALVYQYAKYPNTFYGQPTERRFGIGVIRDRTRNFLRSNGREDQLVARPRTAYEDENDECGILEKLGERLMFSHLRLPDAAHPADPTLLYQGKAEAGEFTVSRQMISYETRLIPMEMPIISATTDPEQRFFITAHRRNRTNYCIIWDHATVQFRHTIQLEGPATSVMLSANHHVFAAFQLSARLSIFDLASGTLLCSMDPHVVELFGISMAIGDNSIVFQIHREFKRLRFSQVDETAFLK